MDAKSYSKMPMAGPFGNASIIARSITLAAAAIATEINFIELPPGTKLLDVKLINDALGASTTLSAGLRYPNGDGTDSATALLPAAATTSAGARTGAFHPKTFDTPVIVTGTVGGGAATGEVTLHVIYEYVGTK